jgi:4-alpha-glucanotransferase
MIERLSGVLLHISSLPSAWGYGDFGPGAFRFADWLAESEQALWQTLPLTIPDSFRSPYASPSAFAMNPELISPEMLFRNGLLSRKELDAVLRDRREGDMDARRLAVTKAYEHWSAHPEPPAFRSFCDERQYWLHDTALFMSIRRHYPGSWYDFPEGLRDRVPAALKQWESEHADTIRRFKFEQFILSEQWSAIKTYANRKGIRIIGDIPIFVSGDSADVWAHRRLFKLDADGVPLVWTGVPPDLFTKTGQLWAQPHFDWTAMEADAYTWWINRVRTVKTHADIIRMDHFRGFCAAYEVPYGSPTAETGQWVEGPRETIFCVLHNNIPDLHIIAEDLGVITPDVDMLRQHLNYPGMKILQFAFNGDPDNPYLPKNFDPNDRFVVYTGTHDNNTTRGWYEEANEEEKAILAHYTDRGVEGVTRALIRMAYDSNAMWAVIPMQDILDLDGSARMNYPGTLAGNWKWQLRSLEFPKTLSSEIRTMTRQGGRSPGKGQ